MSEITKNSDVSEDKKSEAEAGGYRNIMPKGDITLSDAKKILNDILCKAMETKGSSEAAEDDNAETAIEKMLNAYFKDLRDKSECPDTIPEIPFVFSDLKRRTPEENAKMREEFVEKKAQLKKEWVDINGRPWPKYEHDVYSANGKLIRKAGSDYDAHHIQPLGMGGKNEARNITPLSAEVHYDKQGVHAPDSPYSKLDQMLGGTN